MKAKLKIIIPTVVIVTLMAVIVIFNIPYNLNNALHFNESDQIVMSIAIFENVGGQPTQKVENFTFEKGSAELTSINELLDGYSYYLTTAKNINSTGNGSYMANITISDGNSGLYLTTLTGSNIIVNGTNYRMKQSKIEELISKILGICGM